MFWGRKRCDASLSPCQVIFYPLQHRMKYIKRNENSYWYLMTINEVYTAIQNIDVIYSAYNMYCLVLKLKMHKQFRQVLVYSQDKYNCLQIVLCNIIHTRSFICTYDGINNSQSIIILRNIIVSHSFVCCIINENCGEVSKKYHVHYNDACT